MPRSVPLKKVGAKVAAKPAPNMAKPPGPATRRDAHDVDRADSEGMAQPQGKRPKRKPAKPQAGARKKK